MQRRNHRGVFERSRLQLLKRPFLPVQPDNAHHFSTKPDGTAQPGALHALRHDFCRGGIETARERIQFGDFLDQCALGQRVDRGVGGPQNSTIRRDHGCMLVQGGFQRLGQAFQVVAFQGSLGQRAMDMV
ncbi:hypothetical protein D3C80_1156140 [compost metagenome]